MVLDREQLKIVKILSKKYNITEDEVVNIIESPFKFIRKEIKAIEMAEEETEESFESKIKNFNIPYLGKLYGSYYNYKNIKKCQNKTRKITTLRKE